MTAAQESFYIQQLKLGDTCSFQILYEHYYKRIFCYGKCLFPHCEDDLKDGYQDIFIALWKSRERISVEKTLDFYLKRSIKNHMIKVKQKGVKYDGIPNENDSLFLKIQETENFLTSTVAAETKETKQRIFEHKLSLLTKRQRFLFTERFIHEKSVEEIMREHHLVRQTIYNTIYKCLTVMKTGKKNRKIKASSL
jgi:RNA polymerase sigma-70 factor (ECF subfamily)